MKNNIIEFPQLGTAINRGCPWELFNEGVLPHCLIDLYDDRYGTNILKLCKKLSQLKYMLACSRTLITIAVLLLSLYFLDRSAYYPGLLWTGLVLLAASLAGFFSAKSSIPVLEGASKPFRVFIQEISFLVDRDFMAQHSFETGHDLSKTSINTITNGVYASLKKGALAVIAAETRQRDEKRTSSVPAVNRKYHRENQTHALFTSVLRGQADTNFKTAEGLGFKFSKPAIFAEVLREFALQRYESFDWVI